MIISDTLAKKINGLGGLTLANLPENADVSVMFQAHDHSKNEVLALGFTKYLSGKVYSAHTTAKELEKLAAIDGVYRIEWSVFLKPVS